MQEAGWREEGHHTAAVRLVTNGVQAWEGLLTDISNHPPTHPHIEPVLLQSELLPQHRQDDWW